MLPPGAKVPQVMLVNGVVHAESLYIPRVRLLVIEPVLVIDCFVVSNPDISIAPTEHKVININTRDNRSFEVPAIELWL